MNSAFRRFFVFSNKKPNCSNYDRLWQISHGRGLTFDEIRVAEYQLQAVMTINLSTIFKSSTAFDCHKLAMLWTAVLVPRTYYLQNINETLMYTIVPKYTVGLKSKPLLIYQ